MVAELPVERICQPKPCLCTTHQIWGVVHNHGCTWQIRYTGSSAPIFWGRTRFWSYKCVVHQVWVLGIKKIDVRPIFAFLAQPQILGLCFQDAENRRDINFFDAQCLKLTCQKFWHINSSPAPKYGGQTPRIDPNIAKWVLCTKPTLSVFCMTSNFSVTFFLCACNPNSG